MQWNFETFRREPTIRKLIQTFTEIVLPSSLWLWDRVHIDNCTHIDTHPCRSGTSKHIHSRRTRRYSKSWRVLVGVRAHRLDLCRCPQWTGHWQSSRGTIHLQQLLWPSRKWWRCRVEEYRWSWAVWPGILPPRCSIRHSRANLIKHPDRESICLERSANHNRSQSISWPVQRNELRSPPETDSRLPGFPHSGNIALWQFGTSGRCSSRSSSTP